MTNVNSRVSNRAASSDTSTRQFAEDVEYYLGLNPRQLPSRYLYDALGSALFDAICELPWYRITRAERDLLATYGGEIFAAAQGIGTIVELGGGSGEKLVILIEAARQRERSRLNSGGGAARALTVHLVDVSGTALALSARVLSALDNLHIITHESTYEEGLQEVAAERPLQSRPALTLFLGSNIGNFDPPGAEAFLMAVRASLHTGDTFLIGADLVKPQADLLVAYDDPLGVTAAFNRNLLVRLNRELGGTFDLDGFSHRAVWNPEARRVEMHLVSRRAQRVQVGGLDVTFEEGETIWTESSYKYTAAGIVDLLKRCGFRRLEQWTEPQAAFSLTLAEAV